MPVHTKTTTNNYFVREAIFSTAYFPPVSFFAAMMRAEKTIFEKHEHYIKQTLRNRTMIYSANGMQMLVIPVEHENLYRMPIHEVKISNNSPWQKIHWR